ncbi:glycosyltransferase [Lentzea cavernae]|uniref:Glycosyl transferase n=1 Tax=Lentzea cavernae TaxID=2020703 RepID=A0ABQ3MHA5_9PSEU|nr:glycosyltransferase [Lentzea cavernae]GHH43868.1 glycosyl transferase [Lentzea cavernae]
MRIAMVSVVANPLTEGTGQEAHVRELSAALCGLGHEVTVYTRRAATRSADRFRTDEKYEVVQVPVGPAKPISDDELVAHLGEFAKFLAEEWRLSSPDVAHSHHWESGLAALVSAHRVQVPVVHSHHGLGPSDNEERADAERLLARRASWTVATSMQEVTQLMQLGVHRTQTTVVPPGVNLELFEPEGPVAARGSLRRVVSVGRLEPGSGLATAVAALSVVDGIELVIAGEKTQANPVAQQLRRLARQLGVLDRIVFAGAVPHAKMPALLRSADVVVCTPRSDPFGLAALEAMGCGVPVIAAAVGALADVITHNVSGLHIPTNDARALARSLRSLLTNDTKRQELGVAAHDRVSARYSRDRLAKEALAVYQRVEPEHGSE